MSALASSSSSSSEESSAPSSPEALKKVTKPPSRSPDASNKAFSSHTEEPKGPSSCQTPEVCKSLSSSPEPSHEKPRRSPSEEPKVPSSPEESIKVGKSPPRFSEGPKEVRQPPAGDLQPPSRIHSHKKSFKSSLQVLLRRQEEELVKNIEYKEKVEKVEVDEDEGGGGGGGGGDREGSEDDRTKEERKERMKENTRETTEEGAPEEHCKNNKAKKVSKKAGKGEENEEKAKGEEKKQTQSKKDKEKDRKIKSENEKRAKAEKKENKPEETKESGRKRGTEEEEEKCERKTKVKKGEEDSEEGERDEEEEEERGKSTEKREEKQAERKVKKHKMEEKESKAEKKEKKTEVKKTDKEEKAKESMKEGKAKEEKENMRKKEDAGEARTGKEDQQKSKKKEEEENRRKMKRGGSKEEKVHGPLYMKRKRAFNPWKEYYFVLDGLLLTYYRSQHQYERLSGMKGSLDLSLVEAVHPRKAGLMKTHHPFCLSRRNLPSIHLAAATKEHQQRWMAALQAVIQPHRLSCHSSDKTLNTTSTTAAATAHATKAATLPARVKGVNSCSSSVTEEEEEEEEEEEDEDEEEEEEEKKKKEEEEPELIQPKKVLKVPIGLPLARVNLGEVKLKKVEKTEVKREDVDEKASGVAPSPGLAGVRTQAERERETSPPGEVFGVVLKKTRREEEAKEASSTTNSTSSTSRRPSKQPVIPLNSGKLLVVPEVKSPRASPGLQKRGTPERRKSPSPSLPISKSVQALTKSAEEVRATNLEISSTETCSSSFSTTTTTTTTTTESKGKADGVKLCHAQTSEVQYSDVVAIDEEVVKREKGEQEEEDEVGVVGATRRMGEESAKKDMTEKEEEETSEAETQGKKETRDSKELVKEGEEQEHKEEEDEDEAGKKGPFETPMMVDEDRHDEDEDAAHVDLKKSPKETHVAVENQYEYFFRNNDKSVHGEPAGTERQGEDKSQGTGAHLPDSLPEPLIAATPLTPPASPASSVKSTDSDNVPKASSPFSPSPEVAAAFHKPASPSSKLSLSSPKSSPLSSDGRGSEEKAQSSVRTEEGKQQREEEEEGEEEGEEEEEEPPCWASRPRSCTNESSASSSVEGGEKKPGKLQRLRDRLKSGASHKEKENPASPKEKKRRGSNAFSGFLSGKKGKEDSKKHAEEQPQPQPQREEEEEATCEPCASPLHEVTSPSEPPPAETTVPTVERQVTDQPAPHPVGDDLQTQVDKFLGYQSTVDARVTSATDCQARVITYSRASGDSCYDPPPSIPEKTRLRSRSPNHDVPQSNRPVTNLHLLGVNDKDDDEGEVTQTVDGYITEEQIEALLNAKENREKRKRSNSRAQLLAVPGVVKSASPAAAAPTTDDWAHKRPSFVSFSSIDSDESLPATNFLGLEQRSSSSGSFKDFRKSLEADGDQRFSLSPSESGESLSPDTEGPAEPQRRAPRPTDSITAKNRISLTFPEFTVKEEEGLSSPETSKARPAHNEDDDDDDKEGTQQSDDEAESEAEAAAENEDFFPVVGGDVKLRQPSPHREASLDLPTGELRTSGIVGLKEFLKSQEQDDLQEVKSGISRLGHSAAVEKLKQTSSEP